MAEIKVYPIGYIATSNSNSKGNFISGQVAASATNSMFEPNDGCTKKFVGFSAVSNMENRAIWTRKIGDHRHTIEYKYKNIWNNEYRRIKRFSRDIAQYRVNSFYTVDWSNGVKITALATGANWNASIYDTTDFTATQNEGGNYTFIWDGHSKKFRVGIISSYSEDSSITFPNSTDYGDLEAFTEGRVYAYPMYRVYLGQDQENFEVTGFVDANENASYAGPIRSGTTSFIQRDTR